jgi:hypothetical protein
VFALLAQVLRTPIGEHEGSEVMEMGYFELFRVMRLVPQGFNDQTD